MIIITCKTKKSALGLATRVLTNWSISPLKEMMPISLLLLLVIEFVLIIPKKESRFMGWIWVVRIHSSWMWYWNARTDFCQSFCRTNWLIVIWIIVNQQKTMLYNKPILYQAYRSAKKHRQIRLLFKIALCMSKRQSTE